MTKVSPKARMISSFMPTMVETACSNVKSAISVLPNQFAPDFGLGVDLVAEYFDDFHHFSFI